MKTELTNIIKELKEVRELTNLNVRDEILFDGALRVLNTQTRIMQGTSVEAFQNIKTEIGKRQQMIFDTLKQIQPANNRMISEKLNLPINQITPRTNELVKLNLVEEAFRDLDKITNRNTIFWRVIRI